MSSRCLHLAPFFVDELLELPLEGTGTTGPTPGPEDEDPEGTGEEAAGASTMEVALGPF